MTLIQLQCFYNVALLRSITLASEKLFLTQPSVSKHIIQLEQELGFPLIIRSNKGIELTRAGQQMFQHAQLILEQIDFIKSDAAKIKNHIASHKIIRMACVPTMHLYGIVQLISAFMKKYPEYDIVIDELDENRALYNLRSETCDIGFFSDIMNVSDHYKNITVATEGFSALISKNFYEKQPRDYSKLSSFADIPIIFNNPESNLYTRCATACRKAGFEPYVKFSISRSITASQYILNDDVCYIGFDSAVHYSSTPEQLIFKLNEIPPFTFRFYWSKKNTNPSVDFFTKYLSENIPTKK